MEELYEIDEDIMVINLCCELDHHFTECIRDEIDNVISKNRIRYIILNFNGQRFMDSSGIGFIMGRYKKISAYGGKIYVVNLGIGLDRIFHISGLFSIAQYENSLGEAIQKARKASAGA